MDKVAEGDWVHACHNMNKVTGYVVGFHDDGVVVQTTIPKGYGVVVLPVSELIPGSEVIWMDDIPTLIDLSLQLRDREWFEKWRYEMSLWKPVGDVLPQQ